MTQQQIKKIRILDLFAGTQSVRKALDDMGVEYEYIGIDIYSPEQPNTILDLSQDNILEKLINVLPKDWKPDFIWASPLCTTFSRATGITGGTLCYVVDENKKVSIRTEKEFELITHPIYAPHKHKPEFIKKYQDKGKLGLDLWNNTKQIIKYFNTIYCVENPANALSRYLAEDYNFRTTTEYCMYGFDYKKTTAFYTNTELTLKKCIHKKHEVVMSGKGQQKHKPEYKSAVTSNKDRSVVPPLLIKEIISQLMKGGK